jgi:hypothetical protein
VTGPAIAGRMIFRLAADARRLGVSYVATDDGIYRFYGGGLPLCLDTIDGLDAVRLRPGACPPGAPLVASLQTTPGDAIALDPNGVSRGPNHIDLGEVECLIDDGDITLSTVDLPEPASGSALVLLARYDGDADYGDASDGLRRLPAVGDCP